MSNFRARIIAEIDASKIEQQIKNKVESKKIILRNFTIDTKGLGSKIQQALNGYHFTLNLTNVKVDNLSKTITGQMTSAGQQAGQSFSQSFMNRINTAIGSGQIGATISGIRRQFEGLQTAVNNIGNGAGTNELHNRLNLISADLEHLTILEEQFARVGTMSEEELAAHWREYQAILSRVRNNMRLVSNETKMFATTMEVATLDNRMEAWLRNNSKAAKTFGVEIQSLRARLAQLSSQGSVSKTELQGILGQFNAVTSSARAAGLTGKTFADSFKGAFQSISRYVGVSTVIYGAFRIIRNGISNIVDLDTALIDLKKTTDATEAQLKSFYYTANDIAKQLGVTTKEVISAAAEWSRLGYSIKDAETMAQTSSIFASISPGMGIEEATDGLVSAMKAFNIEADDALDGIASKINAIGNSQAVSNKDIVEFLTRSSAAMKEANNTLDDTIALGTAATEITRDASSVGNALKTMSMRIRGYDEETEEYIGNVEILSGKVANLTKTAKTPGGISLFTDESKTTYKSTYELLRDISEIYDDLTDKQQAGLLETLAAKRQGQVVAAILNNFESVESSLQTMSTSAGSAGREMSIIMESLDYKINKLKETGTGIFQNIFASEDMGALIDLLTLILTGIDKLTGAFGLLGTAMLAVPIVYFIKNFGCSIRSLRIQDAR